MPLPEQRHRVPPRRKSTPRGDDGRGEFAGNLVPLQQDDVQRLFHLILLNPPCGGHSADLGGKEVRAPRDGVHCEKAKHQ